MKKLISLLAAIGMVASTSTTVVACPKNSENNNNNDDKNNNNENKIDLNDLKVRELGDVVSKEDIGLNLTLEDLVNAINEKNKDYGLTEDDVQFVSSNNTKAKLKATDSSTKFKGSVEITYNFRIRFNVTFFSDAIIGKGIAAVGKPEWNDGYLMVENYNLDTAASAFKRFVVPLLDKAKLVNLVIDYSDLEKTIKIEVIKENDKNFLQFTSIDGKGYDVQGVYVYGTTKIALKQQTAIPDGWKNSDLGEVKPVDNSDYMIKSAILNSFATKVGIDQNKLKQFSVNSYKKNDSNYEAEIISNINSDYVPEIIKVTFKMNLADESIQWSLTTIVDYLVEDSFVSLTSDILSSETYKELFDYITNTDGELVDYWEQDIALGINNNKFLFDSQKAKESEFGNFEQGTLSYSEFLKNAENLFDFAVNKNSDNKTGTIDIKVKDNIIDLAKGYKVSGEIKLNYQIK
ncbi:hypothetical protein SGLAD_v1c06670 [Spiroplasma gladiatoris]|uniref:Lipoprotein n=1 Tax=Spiroplasma gladiatoris TaxID=2143 RepID=A0A4P7AJM0_9MOLU|nr:lipoprotein [Spiroplasma gladiatoris]QBQ07866.1 hypothetical protein SGLAD_v1c06670 [Spiroplasma gladiatoris]